MGTKSGIWVWVSKKGIPSCPRRAFIPESVQWCFQAGLLTSPLWAPSRCDTVALEAQKIHQSSD